jgi:hypothetical protein
MCVGGITLSACASIPDVEYSYYMSKMTALATVTQAVGCTPDMQELVIVNTPSLVPTYSADLARGPHTIRIRAIEGTFGGFADSDASFGFYDDGRLKSINQTTTGQGETIIKSIVSLSTTVAGLAAFARPEDVKAAPSPSPECNVVKTWADQSKPGSPVTVSLNYSAELNFPSVTVPTRPIKIGPTDSSTPLYYALLKAGSKLPNFTLSIGKPFDAGSRAFNVSAVNGGIGDYVNLTLQRVATVEINIIADKQNTSTGTKAIWKGNVPIPTADTYDLPIPTAALFGTQKFVLNLSEAGVVTAVDYGKSTGAAGAANAAGSIATALTPESATSKVADIKAQADLIAQQQRLNRCQANPTTCQ